ncbi:MAG: glycosyltransferase family 39 protein [Ktedonobacterales bacterium]
MPPLPGRKNVENLENDRERVEPGAQQPETTLWQRGALGTILLLALFLNLFQLGQNQFADITTGVNSYYAAAVHSMALNWHNFFFAAFDPKGFLAIDKPPLGFWVQVLSTRVFGFSAWSLLLPEALAGVGSVAVLYALVRRVFGPVAGLIAALTLALTPISVVASRNNTIDSLLALVLLLAAWALSIAAETGHVRWLLLSALLVGLGFNIKMLEAYLVLPAFALVYLLSGPRSLRLRLLHLALAGVVLLMVSGTWITIVDSTPASQRPYIISTAHDSELELALGYNGVNRAFGAGGTRAVPNLGGAAPLTPTSFLVTFGLLDTGRPGPFRLLNPQLGGQIGWLLLLAMCGLVAAITWQRPRLPRLPSEQGLLLWGAWFLTLLLFFSFALFDHAYYLVTFAPALCALVGIGVVRLYQAYREGSGWRSWLLPPVLVLVVLSQWGILSVFPSWADVLVPVIMSLGLVSALALLRARLLPGSTLQKLALPFATLGLLAVLIAPLTWSAMPPLVGNDTIDPLAGPARAPSTLTLIAHALLPESVHAQPELEHYLLQHQGQATYLVATINASTAAPFILDTGKAVMAIGGFNSFDAILTAQQVAALVARGTVRFFLVPSFTPELLSTVPADFRAAFEQFLRLQQVNQEPLPLPIQPTIVQWVNTHCRVVPRSVAEPGLAGPATTVDLGETETFPTQLFDCGSARSAGAAAGVFV